MPTNNFDPMKEWLDGILGEPFRPYKPVKIVFEGEKQLRTNPFEIQSVLSNRKKNAFTVVWADGTHTTVHCQPGDEWDDEKALAMCFTKKALGNKGNFNDKFNDALDNKMKIIPGGAGIIAERECECDGKRDHGIHSCAKCNRKEEKRYNTIPVEAVRAEHADPNEPTVAEKCAEDMQKAIKAMESNELLKNLVNEVVKDNDPVEIGKALKEVSEKINKTINSFGIQKETADELSKATSKASNSLKEMIDALTGEKVKVPEKKAYCLFKHNVFSGEKTRIRTCYSMQEVRDTIKDYARKQKLGYYYRTWNADGGMYLDYGSHTEYIFVPDITNSEYIGK